MNTQASPNHPKVALIAGPTASGKSALAIGLAARLNGVVINADSAQVYRDLRILSARPTLAEEARVPHLLFGHVDGGKPYSAAAWARDARAAIAQAHAQGRLPILVGGTGLFLRTLIDGIAPVPDIDPAIRATVRALPVSEAYGQLQGMDPNAAGRLKSTDTTRIARALEVVRATGRTLSDWQVERSGGIGADIDLTATILLPDRGWLNARIDARLAAMFAGGARAEVETLLARTDLSADAPVRRAIGVAEITGWISGDWDESEALAKARLATRQYAKRQYTWFRNQPPPDWEHSNATDSTELINIIESKLRD